MTFAVKGGDVEMLDDATIDLAWMIAAVVGVSLFIVASLSSIRALDSLCTLIREKRPDKWTDPGPSARMYRSGPPVFRDRWISSLVLGILRLNIPDDDYCALLWTVRKRMMLCGLLLAAIIAGVIWFSGQR
jgi:hypothetical protein